MLGHKSIATTQKYLGVNYASVREALQKMSFDGELHESGLLGSSLKNTKDETLILELALRGFDLSKLRDEETTAEARHHDDSDRATSAQIIKIG